MTDSSLPAESPVLARCTECGASFKVRHADRTYRCKHCGGEVRADLDDEVAEPVETPAAPKSALQKREHERHVHDIVHDRDERKKFSRERRNVEHAFNLIGNVLWVELFFSVLALISYGLITFAWVTTGELREENDPVEVVIGLTFFCVLVPLLVLMKRRLRHAPVGVALAAAIFQTVGLLGFIVPEFDALVAVASLGAIGMIVLVPLAIRMAFVGFHWFAFTTLRRHKLEREARAHAHDADA